MRQVLLNSQGAVVARMPRPSPQRGEVLVRVRFSMISVGTETAALNPPAPASDSGMTPVRKAKEYTGTAGVYMKLAAKNPKKAVLRVGQMIKRRAAAMAPKRPAGEPRRLGGLEWTPKGASSVSKDGSALTVTTDDSEYGYQLSSQKIRISRDDVLSVHVRGSVSSGSLAVGALNEAGDKWLRVITLGEGPFDESFLVDPDGSGEVTIVISNAGGSARFSIETSDAALEPRGAAKVDETGDQGWNVGYSAAGEVVETGHAVDDLKPGDLVACAGAGKANHADYISVPRNLVCRIPEGCSIRAASSTTIGTIALQGVRRAVPQLGETVVVIGLGLIGQITAQLLRASGCRVIGMDLDSDRVKRALRLGMDAGSSGDEDIKALTRDMTGGKGADYTIITAATRSSSVINLAMELTRRKGRVVVVGDVGLDVERAHFYRKEIDLLMSTSYGPGRYDPSYEKDGMDYPYAYARWTLNRNMRAYMEAVASGRVDVDALIDREIEIDEAPMAYDELVKSESSLPLAVVIKYTDEEDERLDSPRIEIRGARKPIEGPARYALVGAGAFGQSMLVPLMKKNKGHFQLRGVVSRDSVRGGNFARTMRAEVFASRIDEVLDDPGFDLMVIATRHNDHADLVEKSLRAGKHVFTEKPLAVSWEQLDRVTEAYESLSNPPLLMVGFNRRFSPALAAVAEAVKNRRSPLVMSYRLNGGYIPPESWIQGPEGGGRNIGEACHMYDVFRFLAGAPAASVAASGIDPGALPYLRNDNFAATIAYEDGSVGNLVYTALGPRKGMPKERIEIFVDGEAYVVDDFKTVTRASTGEALWKSAEADKGHGAEVAALGKAIAEGAAAPIPYEEIRETTAISLLIEDVLNGRSV